MNERIKSAIADYANEYLFEPERTWPKYYFQQRSYSRWAITEILEYICCHPDISEIAAVAEFASKMDKFAKVDHSDKDDNFIFFVAHDVAIDILDVLIAME